MSDNEDYKNYIEDFNKQFNEDVKKNWGHPLLFKMWIILQTPDVDFDVVCFSEADLLALKGHVSELNETINRPQVKAAIEADCVLLKFEADIEKAVINDDLSNKYLSSLKIGDKVIMQTSGDRWYSSMPPNSKGVEFKGEVVNIDNEWIVAKFPCKNNKSTIFHYRISSGYDIFGHMWLKAPKDTPVKYEGQLSELESGGE